MDDAVVPVIPAPHASPSPSGEVAFPSHAAAMRITVVMPTTDHGEPFARCARMVRESLRNPGTGAGDEWIVVFDGQPPAPPPWLAESGVTLLATGSTLGPAAARHLGAEVARGDVLLFVDADVELADDALERVR